MDCYLKNPIYPLEIDSKTNVAELLKAMGKTAFQAKNLSLAVEIWKDMLQDQATIFLGLAGAMVPAGMRKVIAYLIENRLIDCLVSTGANLFHDLHETLGRFHWQGSTEVNDLELKERGIDRIYDVFAKEEEFRQSDEYIYQFVQKLEFNRAYSTREFLYLLGKRLWEETKEKGILTSAFLAKIPLYCPAIGDSSIGIALALGNHDSHLLFDPILEVKETAFLVVNSPATGVIYIGGGTPKNFIQQTEVTADLWGKKVEGHKYALQITADSPHWGGLSGCTFEEAQSWGKIAKKAEKVTVNCEASLAFPLLVTALVQGYPEFIKNRIPPDMDKLLNNLSGSLHK